MIKRLLIIGALAVAHGVVTMVLFLYSCTTVFHDHLTPLQQELAHWAFVVSKVLMAPLSLVLLLWTPRHDPGLWFYLPFALNSMLWGIALYGVAVWFRRRRGRRRAGG